MRGLPSYAVEAERVLYVGGKQKLNYRYLIKHTCGVYVLLDFSILTDALYLIHLNVFLLRLLKGFKSIRKLFQVFAQFVWVVVIVPFVI